MFIIQILQVVFFYLSCIPKSQHSKALERFCSTMPANPGLALRYVEIRVIKVNTYYYFVQDACDLISTRRMKPLPRTAFF